jgi:hypothetical protein
MAGTKEPETRTSDKISLALVGERIEYAQGTTLPHAHIATMVLFLFGVNRS